VWKQATVLAGLRPQTCSSTVISDVTLLSNVTTFTRPQPLCLSDLYNYMVFQLCERTGYSERDIHKHSVQPLACLRSVSNHVFPLDSEWDKSTQKYTALPLLWTIRLLCRLNYMIMGLLMAIFKRPLVKINFCVIFFSLFAEIVVENVFRQLALLLNYPAQS
uniref:Uncharacterized protein n=1 Tax=Seriola lalandi dorsalis TaxID=1841481 RepID=A0A3B4WSK5_SERLL